MTRHNMQTTRTTDPTAAREYPAARTLPGRDDSPRVLAIEVQYRRVLFDLVNPGTGEVKSFEMSRETWDLLIEQHADRNPCSVPEAEPTTGVRFTAETFTSDDPNNP